MDVFAAGGERPLVSGSYHKNTGRARRVLFVAQVTPGARIRWEELFTCMGKLSREMVLPDGVLPRRDAALLHLSPRRWSRELS